MKRNFLAIMAIVIAMAASAFTAIKDVEKNNKVQQYYWFSLTGAYLGRSASVPSGCDLTNTKNCAFGYINVSNPNDPEQPAGSADLTAKKP
ncbi:MAG: hypothetical protein JST09_18910 [Bacteroidetes bacterium]|nr:hypothetical protein [Bacteroidota bacterium]MBS1747573.1 hypothetical protein [Bacteroidota bacterium]